MEKLLKVRKKCEELQGVNSKEMSRNLNPEYKILSNGKVEVDPKTPTRRGLTTRKINYAKKLAEQGQELVNIIIERRSK